MQIILLLSAVFIVLFSPARVYANQSASASIIRQSKIDESTDDRLIRIEKALSVYRSDLAQYSELIVDISDKYDLPWNLIAAISGVESGFCRNIPKFSYNCWGWANGNRYFTGFEDALETVASGLKQVYFDRGLTTPELINPIYAPPTPSWAWKVRFFMSAIENQTPDISLEFNL